MFATSKFTSLSTLSRLKAYLNTYEKGYNFAFNGKENDKEMYGEGNALDFGSRIYDARLGRWFSKDPQMGKFSSWSPFNFTFDNPILFKDRDGEIPIIIIDEKSKTITIYQPVFVVTQGPGATALADLPLLQKEFDEGIITNHLQAISNTTGTVYNIQIQFNFLEGGTFQEATNKNKEFQRYMGLRVHGTYSTYSTDASFEQLYTAMGGLEDPTEVGGFTSKYSDIFMRGSQAQARERIHEGFHLLLADDKKDAVGILKYTEEYGQGPGVNIYNIQEVISKSASGSSIFRIDNSGKATFGATSNESFNIENKPEPRNSGRGSGMGGLHLDSQESDL
jgi:RHS repeat-associated protein